MMRKLLNILYVSTQGVYLSKEGETVLVSKQEKKLGQVPLANLQGIVCFGNVLCSPFLMGSCAEQGIAMSFLTRNGRFLSRIQGGMCGNILLRKEQYRISDSQNRSAWFASSFLIAKFLNSRAVIQRFLRDHAHSLSPESLERFKSAVAFIRNRVDVHCARIQARNPFPVEELRGDEGHIARLYFSCFSDFITNRRPEFSFTERSKRPPLDRVNAMLSFVYTLLAHDCTAALESVGLDPSAGFLHADRPGRPSLALDLMEEFRACVADRLVLSLINLKQIPPEAFQTTETGAVRMNDDSRKTLIEVWQNRKQDEIVHPFLNEKVQIGMLPFIQSLLLARCVRGDVEAYPPFIYK